LILDLLKLLLELLLVLKGRTLIVSFNKKTIFKCAWVSFCEETFYVSNSTKNVSKKHITKS